MSRNTNKQKVSEEKINKRSRYFGKTLLESIRAEVLQEKQLTTTTELTLSSCYIMSHIIIIMQSAGDNVVAS